MAAERRDMPHFSQAEAMCVFDMLYEGAWHLMAGPRLLGTTAHAMRGAYEACLIEGTAPLFWLEFPLLGQPHSDLHVSYDNREVVSGACFASGDGFGYQGLID